MINKYRNIKQHIKNLCLLVGFFSVSTLVSSASLSSFKPNFDEIESTIVRKEVFFNYLLPVIHRKNSEILELRELILNNALSELELMKLIKQYRIEAPFSKDDILQAIDILPPSLVLAQAANESNWGRSRFAKKFNNYFGIWCFSQGCGVVPKNRDENATHEVASFQSLEDSVDYYMLNINRSYAYEKLRIIRQNHRNQMHAISGIALADGLNKYAFPGIEYIDSIKSLIKSNQLERYDFLN